MAAKKVLLFGLAFLLLITAASAYAEEVSPEKVQWIYDHYEDLFTLKSYEMVFTQTSPIQFNSYEDGSANGRQESGGIEREVYYAGEEISMTGSGYRTDFPHVKDFYLSFNIAVNDIYPSGKGGCAVGYTNSPLVNKEDSMDVLLSLGDTILAYAGGGKYQYKDQPIPLSNVKDYVRDNSMKKVEIIRMLGTTFFFVEGKYVGQYADGLDSQVMPAYGVKSVVGAEVVACQFSDLFVRQFSAAPK